jgi:hypothetical protein
MVIFPHLPHLGYGADLAPYFLRGRRSRIGKRIRAAKANDKAPTTVRQSSPTTATLGDRADAGSSAVK